MDALQSAQELHDEVVAELAGLQKQLGIGLGILPTSAEPFTGPSDSQPGPHQGLLPLAARASVHTQAGLPSAVARPDLVDPAAPTLPAQNAVTPEVSSSTAMHTMSAGPAAPAQHPQPPLPFDELAGPHTAWDISKPFDAAHTGHMNPATVQQEDETPDPREALDLKPDVSREVPMHSEVTRSHPVCGSSAISMKIGEDPAGAPGPGSGSGRLVPDAERAREDLAQQMGDWQQSEGRACVTSMHKPEAAAWLPELSQSMLSGTTGEAPAPGAADRCDGASPGWNGMADADHAQLPGGPLHAHKTSAASSPQSHDWSLGDLSGAVLCHEHLSSGLLTPTKAISRSSGDNLDVLLLQVVCYFFCIHFLFFGP